MTRRRQLADIHLTHMGAIASAVLAVGANVGVMGTSLRGCFLNVDSRWVVFLSIEGYRGPLTLNLPAGRDALQPLENGMPARVAGDQLYFPTIGQRIYFDRAEIWQAPPLPPAALPGERRSERLQEVLRELASLRKTSALGECLVELLEGGEQAKSGACSALPVMAVILAALEARRQEEILIAADAVFGLGAGLTPSGDDLIAGLMLALNRWRYELAADLDLDALNREITHRAYQKTTLISANLIECACQGQADERLVLALDGIMAGVHDPAGCASALASWGNTSGIDALAGMALAVTGRTV